MKEQNLTHFIVIDDDSINNHICLKNIQFLIPKADIQTFTDSKAGMNYLKSGSQEPAPYKTILFLDIDMPVINGWEILDGFLHFPDSLRQQYKIYILTSSIAFEDKLRSKKYAAVSGFIEKPLTLLKLENILSVL